MHLIQTQCSCSITTQWVLRLPRLRLKLASFRMETIPSIRPILRRLFQTRFLYLVRRTESSKEMKRERHSYSRSECRPNKESMTRSSTRWLILSPSPGLESTDLTQSIRSTLTNKTPRISFLISTCPFTDLPCMLFRTKSSKQSRKFKTTSWDLSLRLATNQSRRSNLTQSDKGRRKWSGFLIHVKMLLPCSLTACSQTHIYAT